MKNSLRCITTQKFVYISKKVDVYDLMESDNIEKLEAFVDDEKAHKYDSKDFQF
jgi:hypothetical protein